MRRNYLFLFFFLGSFLMVDNLWAWTLDSSGGATPHEFRLTNVKLEKAGGKPQFEIELNANASTYSPNLPDWPDKTYIITAFGGYDYDSGAVTETIYFGNISSWQMYQSKIMFKFKGKCDNNPWVHGNSSCKPTESVDTTTIDALPGTPLPDTYPLSANYIPNHIHESLVKWEKTFPPEDLSKWDPYAGNEVSNDLSIETPEPFQIISEDAENFQLSISVNTQSIPQVIEMQWEGLGDVGGWQGDIKLPEGSKMWQPIMGPNMKLYSLFPLTLPVFEADLATMYRVRVRPVGATGWSPWRSFWIGKPTVTPAEMTAMVQKGFKNQQIIKKAIIKKMTEQEMKNRSLRIHKSTSARLTKDQQKKNVGLLQHTALKHQFKLINPEANSVHSANVSGKCRVPLTVGSPAWTPFHIKVNKIRPTKKVVVDATWGSQSPGVAASRWKKENSGQWLYSDRIMLEWGSVYQIDIKPASPSGQSMDKLISTQKMPIGNTSAQFKTVSSALQSNLKSQSLSIKKQTLVDKSKLTPVIIGPKRSYRAGESVRFSINAEKGKKPIVECFDGKKWTNKCPRDLKLQKTGSGEQVKYQLRSQTAGKFRIRIGKVVSDVIEVKKAFGSKSVKPIKVTRDKQVAVKTPPRKGASENKEKQDKTKKETGKSKNKMPVKFDKPKFSNLNYDQSFPEGSTILFNLKHIPALKKKKVKYQVYKNTCKGKPYKVSTSNNFGKLPVGKYCVRAAYLGAKSINWSKGIPFIVKKEIKKINKQNIKKNTRKQIGVQ